MYGDHADAELKRHCGKCLACSSTVDNTLCKDCVESSLDSLTRYEAQRGGPAADAAWTQSRMQVRARLRLPAQRRPARLQAQVRQLPAPARPARRSGLLSTHLPGPRSQAGQLHEKLTRQLSQCCHGTQQAICPNQPAATLRCHPMTPGFSAGYLPRTQHGNKRTCDARCGMSAPVSPRLDAADSTSSGCAASAAAEPGSSRVKVACRRPPACAALAASTVRLPPGRTLAEL